MPTRAAKENSNLVSKIFPVPKESFPENGGWKSQRTQNFDEIHTAIHVNYYRELCYLKVLVLRLSVPILISLVKYVKNRYKKSFKINIKKHMAAIMAKIFTVNLLG